MRSLGENPVNYLASAFGLVQVLIPVVAINAAVVVLPALGVHAVVTGGLFALLSGRPVELDQQGRPTAAGILASTAVILGLQPLLAPVLGSPILGGPEPLLLGPATAFTVVAAALVRPSVVGADSLRGLARRALIVGAVAGLAVGTATPGTTGWIFAVWVFRPTPPGATAWDGLGFALMVAGPTLALLPAGASLAEGRTRAALTSATAGAALGWAVSPVLYFAQTGGIAPGILLGLPAVGATLLLGAPLLLAGWVFGDERASTPQEP